MKLLSRKGTRTPFEEESIEDPAAAQMPDALADEDLLDAPEKKKNVFQRLFHKKGSGPRKPMTKKGKILLIVCIAAVIALVVCAKLFWFGDKASAQNMSYTAAVVQKRDISVTLSGSGTLAAANSYNVTSLVSGEVTSANFEKGDTVKAGDTLYQIDPSDAEESIKSAQLNVEKAELSYQNAQKALTNLNVTAPVSGTVTELDVKVGDNVQSGSKIGVVRDSSAMTLKVPFNTADVSSFYVGESASVTLDSTFETLTGYITKITRSGTTLSGNMIVDYVTIAVTNPGAITDSTTATAKVGNIACTGSATFSYKSSESITAKASGTISSLTVGEGDRVSSGSTVAVLSSDDAQQQLQNAKLSLEDAQDNLESKQKALEDYTITSPIDGTVIEKNVKVGDKLSNGSVAGSSSSGSSSSSSSSSSSAMCKIYDLSYLTMEIDVDELDVSEVKVGQKVTITADAVEGKTYTGEVTNVSISGTTSNGVTAYPVTVKITDTDGLLPGMNVDAKIVVESVSNVLSIPVDAVSRGNTVYALTDSSASYKDGDKLSVDDDDKPVGFKKTKLTLGLSSDDYIEIKSGLKEGDVIAVGTVVQSSTSSSSTTSGSLGGLTGGGGMTGGGGGGGMPEGGGGGGGMPGGGQQGG